MWTRGTSVFILHGSAHLPGISNGPARTCLRDRREITSRVDRGENEISRADCRVPRAVNSSPAKRARSRISFCFKDHRTSPPGIRGSWSLGTVDDTLIPDACRYPVNGSPLSKERKDSATYEMLEKAGELGNEDRNRGNKLNFLFSHSMRESLRSSSKLIPQRHPIALNDQTREKRFYIRGDKAYPIFPRKRLQNTAYSIYTVQLINFRLNSISCHNTRNDLNIYNMERINAVFIMAIENDGHSTNFQFTQRLGKLRQFVKVYRVSYRVKELFCAKHKKDVDDELGIFQT